MNWMDTKLAARSVVHQTFGRPARFYSTGVVSGMGVPVFVRVHGSRVMTGDLDREGYSEVVEDVETIVFLKSDVDAHGIARRAAIKMDDTQQVYLLVLREPVTDNYTVTFQVNRKD